MNSNDMLNVVKMLSVALDMASSANVNINRMLELKRRASNENRDISDEELLDLKNEVKAGIDELKNS